MKVIAFIERGTDGTYSVYIPDNKLPFGFLGEGKTVEEAKSDFFTSFEDMKEFYKEKGGECPEVEFELKYDLPSFLQAYSKIFSFGWLERITGVNQRQLSQYVNGYRNPSVKTARKIEEKLHEFGEELSRLTFV